MKIRGLKGAVIGLGLCYAAVASAQDQIWLKDRRYTEGMGVRSGDFELHPGVAAEFGYDSNYFLRAGSQYNEPVADTLRLRLTPSLSLSTIGPQRREGDVAAEAPKFSFRAGAAAVYNEFIATQSQFSDSLSKQRNIGGLANLQLHILPQRPWSGDVYGDFLRMVQPSNNPDTNFNRISARAGAGLVWMPGGGMFDWRLGYEFGTTLFEDESFRQLSNIYHQLNTRGRWRFLPRTAFLYDGSLSFYRYINEPRNLLPSDPVRARLGLNGLVTPSFALLAMAGWGSSFYHGDVTAQQFDSFIGQAELKWYITPNPSTDPSAATLALSSLAIGYTRDFINSYLGDFFTQDRGYLRLSHFFGGRFLAALDAGLASRAYPNLYVGDRFGSSGRTSVAPFSVLYPDANLFGEYRFTDSLGVNATLRYTANVTDQSVLPAGAPAGANPDYLRWERYEAYLGVRWFL